MIKNDIEDRRKFIINVLYFALIIFFIYFLIKYAIVWLLPFIFAFLIASAAEPIITKLVTKYRIKRTFAVIFSIFLIFVLIILALLIFGSLLTFSISSLSEYLPQFYNSLIEQAEWLSSKYDDFLFMLPESVTNYIVSSASSFMDSLPSILSSMSLPVLNYVKNFALRLPAYLVFLLVTIAATILLSLDFKNAISFVKKQIPTSVKPSVMESISFFKLTVVRLIKAYIIICSITFIELNIGFFILGIKQGLAIAAITALVDVLPIVGCGTILVPWAIVSLIFGDFKMAISLAILYIIITSIRQVLEPKIVGDTIGLHPVAAIFGIYLGLSFFGIFGMFLVPILMIVMKNLQDKGYIKLWQK